MCMKLIVGLGNPGTEYAKTRHNFGWSVLDKMSEKAGYTWNHKQKFTADIAEFDLEGEKNLLVKPTTYYNLSGEAIRKIKDFYNINNSNILVIHDEMALPMGIMRTRVGGSDAGNNGIKSLIQHLGPDFARLRIGSGKNPVSNGDARPEINHRDHVLSRPNQSDMIKLEKLYPSIEAIIFDFVRDNFTETTYRI